MSTNILDQPMVCGPTDVPLGRRIVSDKRDYFPFPRQKFPIDRALLAKNGYGDAAIAHLERGSWITYDNYAIIGPELGNIEFPDGSRLATALKFLGGEMVEIAIVKRLADAIRWARSDMARRPVFALCLLVRMGPANQP